MFFRLCHTFSRSLARLFGVAGGASNKKRKKERKKEKGEKREKGKKEEKRKEEGEKGEVTNFLRKRLYICATYSDLLYIMQHKIH